MPPLNFNGNDTISYTIDDGNGGTDTAAIAITVTPVNDAPDAAIVLNQNNQDGDPGISVDGFDHGHRKRYAQLPHRRPAGRIEHQFSNR